MVVSEYVELCLTCNRTDLQQPVAYSGNGTHATYATTGTHDHTIPNFNLPAGPIEDYCDQGYIWDPTLSAYYAKYDANTKTFSAYDDR